MILFALMLPVLLGFFALTVDLARLYLLKVELQNAADAAALAGAQLYPDQGSCTAAQVSCTAAQDEARNVAGQNAVNGELIITTNVYVDCGSWSNASFSTASCDRAIRVTIKYEPVQFFFAPVLGIDDRDSLQAIAIAVNTGLSSSILVK
ncbi:pilus assembly protein TadG-related protein [Prosthecochloris sp. CIB 2401]|uniref:pilus assembly protein TadG-related protein n=1 Tax=Prosthecochloris sp. CIB 2401 TaxID=1868325 RepID=UPI00194E0F57|nr:pilus assembly protein TadG-related protein [Prosthecochloris sp. CIB 2401]